MRLLIWILALANFTPWLVACKHQVMLFGVMTIPDIASEGADFVNRLQVGISLQQVRDVGLGWLHADKHPFLYSVRNYRSIVWPGNNPACSGLMLQHLRILMLLHHAMSTMQMA